MPLKIRNLAQPLFCALIGLSVVACATPSRDARTEEVYNRLMAQLSDDVVGVSWGGNKTPEGTVFPYRTEKRAKSLAVCINWDESSRYKIAEYGWSSFSGSRRIGASKTASMHDCQQNRESKYTCECQIVDANDKNVLEVPDDFLTRYSSTTDQETGVPDNLRKSALLSRSDDDVCRLALSTQNEFPQWDDWPLVKNAVNEAKKRSFTPEACAQLVDR